MDVKTFTSKNCIQTLYMDQEKFKDNDGITLKVYKRRWLMLGLFILFAASNVSQWMQYSIIANIIIRYYNVSAMAVDCTSMAYLMYYIILIFPISYLNERIGLRRTLILGSCLNCLGAWIKIFSVAPNRFYVTFIGQSLVACTQAMVLPIPGRLAAKWFGTKQLSTATSLGIFGSQVGIAAGFLLTPMIVRNHVKHEDIGSDLSFLFWCFAGVTTAVMLLIVLFFQDEPNLPPSETRALQKANRTGNKEGFVQPMKRLFKNKSFLVLCNSYGLNIGVLNVVATLLNQMFLMHFKDGEKDAGIIGLGFILTGIAGSVAFGYILDRTHKFKATTVIVYFLSLCGQILFAMAMFLAVKWMVYGTAVFLGFFMSGYIALGYEICAEYTYPENETLSTGILNVAQNIYGIIMILVLGKTLEVFGDVPVHIGLCLALFVGFILTLLTKDEQRRQDAKMMVLYQGIPIRHVSQNKSAINGP